METCFKAVSKAEVEARILTCCLLHYLVGVVIKQNRERERERDFVAF